MVEIFYFYTIICNLPLMFISNLLDNFEKMVIEMGVTYTEILC